MYRSDSVHGSPCFSAYKLLINLRVFLFVCSLEAPTKLLGVLPTDERAVRRKKGLVDVALPSITSAQPSEAMTPSRTLPIDPTPSPEPFTQLNITARNSYCDPYDAVKAGMWTKQMPDEHAAYLALATQTRILTLYAQDPPLKAAHVDPLV